MVVTKQSFIHIICVCSCFWSSASSVFNIPGLGRLTVDAVLKRDYPVVQGLILVFAGAKVLVNLIIDISYAFLDPRIRY